MGQITHVSELPSDPVLDEYIREAARLNSEGSFVQNPGLNLKRRFRWTMIY